MNKESRMGDRQTTLPSQKEVGMTEKQKAFYREYPQFLPLWENRHVQSNTVPPERTWVEHPGYKGIWDDSE